MPVIENVDFRVGLPPLNTTTGSPSDGCSPYTDASDLTQISGKAIVVSRGGCDFYNKTVHLAEAGASAIIVKNTEELSIMRMGVSPRWLGLSLRIPLVMVSGADGGEIEKLEVVKFERDEEVDLDAWVLINELKEDQMEGTSVAKYKGKRYVGITNELGRLR